jgi:subtilase family protein
VTATQDTAAAGGGAAANWPVPEHRTAAQLAADLEAARQQARALTPEPPTVARVNVVLEQIRTRQKKAPAGRATTPFVRFGLDGTPGPAGPLLAGDGQLVVEPGGRSLTQLNAALGNLRYTPADRRGRSVRRTTRVYRGSKAPAELAADIAQLRASGITASVNLIAPLGYVIKGDDYPAATTGRSPFTAPAPAAPVRVAVVDTGVTAEDRTDSWLDTVVRNGIDPIDELSPTGIDHGGGHGSFVAGLVQQLAPAAEVVVYRFTGPDGLGTDEAAADMLIKAAEEGAGRRLIINASFGTPAFGDVPPLAMREAVRYIGDAYPDVLIVASAGNDGSSRPMYPAAFPGVVAVGALRSDLTPAAFSNKGDWVDCSSVGVGVVSTYVQGSLPPEPDPAVPPRTFQTNAWALWTGTSFSAPQVSGAIACLCGADATVKPRTAFDRLLADRPTQQGYGTVVHLLRGTPDW